MAMEAHPGEGVTVLYHLEAELVGSRKKMSEKRLVQDFEYADDLCLVAASRVSLEGMLHSLHGACTELGLSMNWRFCLNLHISTSPPPDKCP